MIYIRFVRGHWKIYIVAVLLTVVVSMIYGLFFKEKAYESTVGLYYPAATSELVEFVSDRDFMDDAAAIMGQEIMLEKVEQDTGVAWKAIKQYSEITVNQDTGITNITVRMADGKMDYSCAKSIVNVFCNALMRQCMNFAGNTKYLILYKLPVLYRAFRILNDPTMLKYEKQLQLNIPEIWKSSI